LQKESNFTGNESLPKSNNQVVIHLDSLEIVESNRLKITDESYQFHSLKMEIEVFKVPGKFENESSDSSKYQFGSSPRIIRFQFKINLDQFKDGPRTVFIDKAFRKFFIPIVY